MDSVILYAYRNRWNRFFVTTKHNYFGQISAGKKIQVENLMVDSGCNTLLLPIQNQQQIDDLISLFGNSEYYWQVNESRTVSGSSLVLVITKILGSMQYQINADSFPDIRTIPNLRFYLCRADYQHLRDARTNHQVNFVGDFPVERASITRRSHGLIGQAILADDRIVSITYGPICVLVDPSGELFTDTFKQILGQLIPKANQEIEHFGRQEFNDLEDEDHDLSDLSTYYMNPYDCED